MSDTQKSCLVDVHSKANSKNQIRAFFNRNERGKQVEDLGKQMSKIGRGLTSSRNFINCLMKAQKKMEGKEGVRKKGERKRDNK